MQTKKPRICAWWAFQTAFIRSLMACIVLFSIVPVLPSSAAETDADPVLLSWSKQLEVREQWLVKRHEMLLNMMRAHEVDMWIIVNEEFHDDPLTEYIAPPRPYTGNRDVFLFIDAGDAGLRKVAIVGYAEENLTQFFESPDEPRPAKEVLPELYKTHNPQRIALNIDGRRGVTRSLTHATYLYLREILGEEASQRFVGAENLIEEYLDTRIPEEFEYYATLVHLTELLIKRVLSNEAVIPGKTTIRELRLWLYDALWQWGVSTWFQPDFRVQRKASGNETSRGFLAVAKEDIVVQRGDLLHVDFGISHMGFDTDWQKMAYVLHEGETDAPEGLKKAVANTNALQDALMLRASRPGRTAAEAYQLAMQEMEAEGIQAQIYSHPLGNHGHGLGASIDFRAAKRKDESRLNKRLRKGSYIAIELNTKTAVPEWDGQEVYIMHEDPAYLTDEGWKFFRPRQEALYLIH